ncbi:MAG: acylphosphatase [Actinomycetota bacterium]
MRRVHVHASGLVQGVFYRAECERTALALGLGGWVRNLSDGRVEMVFEGREEAVAEALEWCRKGTRWSRVERVDVADESPEGETRFSVR